MQSRVESSGISIPHSTEEVHHGFKIGIERDSNLISPYCERNLDFEGKKTAYVTIRNGYDIRRKMPNVHSIVEAFNSQFIQSCTGINEEIAVQILERQLKAFYPEKRGSSETALKM
jgi:hypothetical protein